MADARDFVPFQVLLSYEELACLARLLGAQPLVGVDDNPLAGRSPGDVDLALAVAGRSLAARRLIQADAPRGPAVQTALLEVVGCYCFPQRVASLAHWQAGEDAPIACFGYVRGEKAVLHQRPSPDLHEFTLMPGGPQLAEAMMRFAGAAGDPAAPADGAAAETGGLDLPLALVAELRRQSPSAVAAALDLADQGSRPALERFVAALGKGPQVTAFTTVRGGPGEQVERREFSYVRQNGDGWLLQGAAGASAEPAVHVRAAAPDEVRGLLVGALG